MHTLEDIKKTNTPAAVTERRLSRKERKAALTKARRLANIGACREKERMYAEARRKDKPGVVREANRRADARRAGTDARRASGNAASARYRAANPEKHAAAVKASKLKYKQETLARKSTPDKKDARKKYLAEYWKRPEVIARLAAKEADPKVRAARRDRLRLKYANSPRFRLLCQLHNRLTTGLRHGKFNHKTRELVGASVDVVIAHLEAQFKPGMTWDNWGSVWHVDHKYPLSKIDHACIEQIKRVCHYTNLQPLWVEDNLRKHAKVIHGLPELENLGGAHVVS